MVTNIKVSSSPLGSAFWLLISLALLLWAATVASYALHAAAAVFLKAVGF